MTTTEAIQTALEPLKAGLDADGFDLRLDAIDSDGTIRIVLEALPAACLDCLVPDEFLIRMLDDRVHKEDPSAGRVLLEKRGFEGLDAH